MRISDFSVRNYQFTVVLFAMLAALGVSAWFAIPRGEDPTFPVPIYTVVAVLPGAAPTDLERLVVEPIEERFAELDEVKQVESRVQSGLAITSIEFLTSADADAKHDEVVRELDALRPRLPAQLARLSIEKNSSAEVNVAQVALVSSTAPWHVLQAAAERIEERIEQVPGVRGVETWGWPAREVRVSLDLGRLATLGLPPTRVLDALGSEAATIPSGTVDAGLRRFNVRTRDHFRSVEDVRGTVIGGGAGRTVTVGDVAEVEWGYADATHLARLDGKRAVWLTVTQQPGRNIAAVRDGVWATLDEAAGSLPSGVALERPFDQSRNVSSRLSRLGVDFAIAILLVLVTLLPLGLRASLVVMISIPLSLAMGVTLLHWTGFSINQLSIVGFVIALGLLVDDSIVVVENIARFLREGRSRTEAAILGTKQIAVAVVGCTATLVFAFLPLLFLPGLPGRYIRSLPVTVVYTVLASLVVSLTIIPWLSSLLLRETDDPHGNRAFRWLERGIHRSYAPLLARAIARPKRTLAGAAALVVATFALVPVVGFSLFPKAQTPQFLVDVRLPDGASLEATDRAVRWVEGELRARPEVRHVLANVGRDNPQVYYNVIPRGERPNAGQLFVLLRGYDAERTPAAFDSLRARFATYAGARIELKEFENGPPIDAPIAMRVVGPDLDSLRAIAGRVERVLATTPGTQYVNDPVRVSRTDLEVAVDRRKAGLAGVPAAEVERTLRLALAGIPGAKVRTDDGEEHAVVVRLPHDGPARPEALDRVHVPSVTGRSVPLRQVAEVRFATQTPSIQRMDRERAVTVSAHVRSGYVTDRVTGEVLARLDSLALPAGYRIVPAGEIESRQESFGGIGGAIIVAVFMILAILVLEFRTFRSTLIVASVIPLGVVGGILALLLSGHTLSFTAMIGFVALIGIEIKTSILLVDFTNQLRAEGWSLDDAIRHAGEVRFVPIVLTTLTAIGGLLPLAVQGSALYSPLAWVIIGGLVSSTVLARLVTPVMYRVLAPEIAVGGDRRAATGDREAPSGVVPATA